MRYCSVLTSLSQSKTLLAVFKEAKAAYRERKAEIVAVRHVELEAKKAQRALEQLTIEERSVASRTKSRSRSHHTRRPPTESGSRREGARGRTVIDDDQRTVVASTRGSVVRRHTAQDGHLGERRHVPSRSASFPSSPIDMDLAYGELPPADTPRDEAELKTLMSRVTTVLDEAHCVHHSVTATIAALQRDPDALAAVALTLAEISNLVAKMAPGALMTMKGSFPAVFALLASPQFMIAAGVGVGVVVVALGGYKIIKKIRERAVDDEEPMDQLQEIDVDVNRIDAWRRGVSDADAASVSTSVDAEFITPEAAAIRRADGDTEVGSTRHKKRKDKSRKPSRSSRSGKDVKPREKRTTEPSKLRLLFT